MCKTSNGTYTFTEIAEGEVQISAAGEEITSICISSTAAKIIDSYKLNRTGISETISYLLTYCKNKGYTVSRTNSALCGEVFLHNTLYKVGYKRGSTKDCDLDFIADRRWYVNLASILIGWIFF